MPRTKLEMWNLALEELGTEGSIASLDEDSREAELCNRFHDHVVDLVQEAAWWPSSRRVASLTTPLATREGRDWKLGDPEPGYRYAYVLPTGEDAEHPYLRPWYLTNGGFFTNGTYQPAADSTTPLQEVLNTNSRYVELFFAVREPDPDKWIVSQYEASYMGLASRIALALTGSQELAKAKAAEADYRLRMAQADALNRQSQHWKSLPPWLAIRHGDVGSQRYIYPHGVVFSTTYQLAASDWVAYPDAQR